MEGREVCKRGGGGGVVSFEMQTEVDAIMERQAGQHARPDHAQDARGGIVSLSVSAGGCGWREGRFAREGIV